MRKTAYLGDGLYAKFENMQIILMANDPNDPSDTVYIEWPNVYNSLVEFVRRSTAPVARDLAEQEQRLQMLVSPVSLAPLDIALPPDKPCAHPGCLSHVTHPCEGCGRIGGFYPKPEAE